MKVYNKQDFLKLPEGTIFASGCRWAFDNICVKGESLENDFIYRSLINIQSEDSGEWFDRLEDMLDDGKSYPINQDYGRDGLFDDDIVFLVYENDDIKELILTLVDSLR